MAFLGGGRSGAWGRLLLSRVLAFSRLPLGLCVCVSVPSFLGVRLDSLSEVAP